MTRNIKLLIGAGIGAGIGYFIGAIIAETIALKEWEAEHGHDFEYEDLDEDPGNDDETNLGPNIYENSKKMPKKTVKNYSEQFQKRPDIAALAAKYRGEELPITEEIHEKVREIAVDEGLIEEEFDVEEEDVDSPEIEIISMADYANSEGLEAVTLYYYDDDVVTDEHGNPVDRPEEILGDEALVSFGELSEDPDVVYVRNQPKRAVYEVVRKNQMYAAHRARRDRKLEVKRRLTEEDDHGEDHAAG